jgi:hypothetical protein
VKVLWHEDTSLLEKTIIGTMVNAKKMKELYGNSTSFLGDIIEKKTGFKPSNYADLDIKVIHIPDCDWDTTKPLFEQVFPYLYFGFQRQFSDYVSFKPPKHLLLYFDRVDRMFDHPGFYMLISHLAHDVVAHPHYNVFVSLFDRKKAAEMITWNGGEKHGPVNHQVRY